MKLMQFWCKSVLLPALCALLAAGPPPAELAKMDEPPF